MWKIYNEAKGKNGAEILLYDTIASFDDEDFGYVRAKTIINEIKALENEKEITLRINSIGGDIFQGFAIYNTLLSSKAKIIVRIDGIAASSASLIAMAGDKIIMPENSMMMLHNPWGTCSGDAEEMRSQAELLDKLKEMCIKAYQAKTGLTAEKLSELMGDETYLSATECKELKLCDEVVEKIDVAAEMRRVTGPASSFKESEIAKIQDEARMQERERIKALDELLTPNREALISRAKYEEPKDAKEIALELLKADSVQARMSMRNDDASVLNGLQPSNDRTPKQVFDEMVNAITMKVNEMRGYVKNG